MPLEPQTKRVVAFIDGQNLFFAVKSAFGSKYPDYDPQLLATSICASKSWELTEVRFYTGVPDAADHPFWNRFWNNKLAILGTRQVHTFSRPLRYQNHTVQLPDGSSVTYRSGHEKGVDIRIALDVISSARAGACDVILLFSQDQDFSEVALEVRAIAQQQNRWIKVASAYPVDSSYRNRRGIERTDWIGFDRQLYSGCTDPTDYRQ